MFPWKLFIGYWEKTITITDNQERRDSFRQKIKKKRLKFARKAKNFPSNFWKEHITFYFDGVGFAHETNPYAEARAVSSMTWRKPGEGLSITTKGRKEGSCGQMAQFYVAIAYGKGVVMCNQYHWRVTGEWFASLIDNAFPGLFQKRGVEPHGRLWLQDGDPRQVSQIAKMAWKCLGCEMFGIPRWSPDLNLIENIFHIVRKQLKSDALELKIKNETYAQFSKRVANTIQAIPIELIDKTINSMERRVDMIIKKKGERTKY